MDSLPLNYSYIPHQAITLTFFDKVEFMNTLAHGFLTPQPQVLEVYIHPEDYMYEITKQLNLQSVGHVRACNFELITKDNPSTGKVIGLAEGKITILTTVTKGNPDVPEGTIIKFTSYFSDTDIYLYGEKNIIQATLLAMKPYAPKSHFKKGCINLLGLKDCGIPNQWLNQ